VVDLATPQSGRGKDGPLWEKNQTTITAVSGSKPGNAGMFVTWPVFPNGRTQCGRQEWSGLRHKRKSAFFLKRTFPVPQNEVSADFKVQLQGVFQLDGEWPSRGSICDKGSLTYSGTNQRPASLK
jgi:hypothetical protein